MGGGVESWSGLAESALGLAARVGYTSVLLTDAPVQEREAAVSAGPIARFSQRSTG